MKKNEPLVMCLTNHVAAEITANALLAIGAKPAMVEEASEAVELAGIADAMLVNLGTVNESQAEAMRAAIGAAGKRGMPWVLDPVAVQLLGYRAKLAREFLALGPSIVRGNHAEIEYLRPKCAYLSTGETDRTGKTEISGGNRMLTKVTATGCAQGAVCAAYLGRGMGPEEACEAASKLMKAAGERAAERAKAPGSFKTALIDALWELGND